MEKYTQHIDESYVIGYYNELKYRIEIDGEEVYTAGNSPYDSQGYTAKENGVGLEEMRKFCEHTAKEMAQENKAKFIGVEYEEVDE